MRNSVITVMLFVVGMVGAGLTAYYGMHGESSPEGISSPLKGMAKDLVITLFQFFVIVVLGGGISFVHQLLTQQREDHERAKILRREKRAEERQLLLSTYNDFLAAYDKAKRARRILRARVLRPESECISPRDQEIMASLYDEQMETLIDAQLELESIEFRMRGNAGLFAPLSELDSAATSIRNYLHATVEEYQDRRTEFAGEPPKALLAELPALLGFIGSYGRGQAWTEFNKPFQNALRCLRLAVQERSSAGAEALTKAPTVSAEVSASGLGVDDEKVQLQAHYWEWPNRFREESERLQAELDRRFDAIEHVGSTRVRGIWAMPVIDMLARVPTLSDDEKERLREDLAKLNYELCPGQPDGVDLAFRQYIDGLWTHSLAVVQENSSYFESAVQMRDHLINDSVARREFDSQKRALASKYANDPEAYQREKTNVIAAFRESVATDTTNKNPATGTPAAE